MCVVRRVIDGKHEKGKTVSHCESYITSLLSAAPYHWNIFLLFANNNEQWQSQTN